MHVPRRSLRMVTLKAGGRRERVISRVIERPLVVGVKPPKNSGAIDSRP